MNPINKTYTINNGRVDAGRLRPSGGGGGGTGSDVSWVPPSGYFADVPMTNMPADLNPAIYAGNTSAMRGPFDVWGGSAFLRDFSTLGGQVFYSGGHENSAGQVNTSVLVVCDFSDLTWKIRNVPLQANPANTGLPTGLFPDGTPYCFHTYNGLEELPYAWGGGPQGSLIAVGLDQYDPPGRGVTVADVSQANAGYSLMPINQFQNATTNRISMAPGGGGGTRLVAVRDDVRQGYWIAADLTVSYTLFLSKTGLVTQYPALGGNSQDGALVLVPSKNLLIVLDGGYDETNPNYGGTSYRRLYIRDLTLPWTGDHIYNSTTGEVPTGSQGYDQAPGAGGMAAYHSPGIMGLQWVEELGCIVGFDTQRTLKIWKLTPSNPNNLKTATWAWSVVEVAHWSADVGGQATLQVPINNAWSKFRWIPTLQAFVLGIAADKKPQVIRIS